MKKFVCTALAVCMALSLAACGGSGSGSSAAGGSSAATGSSAAASTGEGGSIKVGLLANTSDANANYGNAVKNGAMLYINEVNAAGGVNGKQIEVVAYDDKGEATEAVTAFNRLLDDGVTAVIGSVLTGTTIAVADESYAVGMPQITASATAPGVTLLDPEDESSGIRENVFRACFIDPFQGEKMAEYAFEKMGVKTAAVIFETGNDYSEGLKNAFVEKCQELGVTVTNEEAYSTGDVDFKAQMTNIAKSAPDVVFSPNYYEDDGKIVTQARQAGYEGTFLGGDGWSGVGPYASAEDLEGTVYCSAYAGDETFESAYEAAYGEKVPNMFAPLGYDAAKLMLAALGAAEDQGLEAGSDEYKAAVIDALKATDGVEGVTGSYKFDEFNNPIKSAAMMQLQNGEEVFTEMF
ncbi:ABC transporter substrate-binding protein [Anaerofilum sp. BX8]|uniref:ABC transporter substrate-binding protein n=1 Tax=Anaerofilum hominis TaxID=2763016 RepID=A0A923RFE7_9FIRM|nr:ABC transporter substrate-binding protein [Anaerofilum hominis]MBC5582439.1 ABC transporter substrate-binding protein [Anaerofilum hominis]